MNSARQDPWPEWPVCRLEEINDPGARGFYVGDGDWPFRGFVVRRNDQVFAYANICPHRRHPLDLVPDEFLVDDGRIIRCASHGALFDPESGLCLAGPCAGHSLMRLTAQIDPDRNVLVTAPSSLLDAGPIMDSGFDTV